MVELSCSVFCVLPIGMLEGVVVLVGSVLPRLLLREKNDVDCPDCFEVLDAAEDVIEALRPGSVAVLPLSSALSALSAGFADRKPNAPREAIVAGWLATHLKAIWRLRTWERREYINNQIYVSRSGFICAKLLVSRLGTKGFVGWHVP